MLGGAFAPQDHNGPEAGHVYRPGQGPRLHRRPLLADYERLGAREPHDGGSSESEGAVEQEGIAARGAAKVGRQVQATIKAAENTDQC